MSESLVREIKNIIQIALKDKPIVIWYDDGETLKSVMGGAVPESTNYIEYNGSYLAIRAKLEESDSHLKQKWFIYIGHERKEKSWLRDYELFGKCINYNIERLLVERFGFKSNLETKKLLAGQNGDLLAQNWEDVIGEIDGDIVLEQIKEALLSIHFQLFPKFDVKRSILEYLTFYDSLSHKLTETHLHQIFNDKIIEFLGINSMRNDIVDPEILASAIFLSEFVESSGLCEEEFSLLIPDKNKRKHAVNLLKDWSNNTSLRSGFLDWSERLSSKYEIRSKIHGLEKLVNMICFKEVDESLLDELLTRIISDGFELNAHITLKIAQIRKNSFWSKIGEFEFWNQIYPAAHLFNQINRDMEKLEDNLSMDDFIRKYTAEWGWWVIDEKYLDMSSDKGTKKDEINEYIIKPTSKKYGEWLDNVNRKFSESVIKRGQWKSKYAYPQREFWDKNVSGNDNNVAVLYIDALRYDLAKKLSSKLKKKSLKVKITPMLSSVPSITEVGMAALLPKNESKISLQIEDGKLKTGIKDKFVTSKNERKKWIKKVFSDAVFLDLNEIYNCPKEDIVDKIGKSKRIFVMDREIDELGTFITKISVSFFKDSINKIVNAVENLHNAGIQKIIIGTDHGFILLPPEIKIENIPSIKVNNETRKGRRFIVGKPPLNDALISFDFQSIGYVSQGIAEFPRGLHSIPVPGETGIIHGGISLQENCVASIISIQEVKSEKIGVNMETPELISTKIFKVKIIPIFPAFRTVTFSPRKIKIQLFVDDNLSHESKEYIIIQDPVDVLLSLEKMAKTVNIRVKDIETGEIMISQKIPVKLEGYDDIL